MGELKPEEINSIVLSGEEPSKPTDSLLQVPSSTLPSAVSLTELDTIDRETWGKKVDFLLSVIGFAVDLGNVWRFPYLCFKNGGGVFFIPYLLMLVLAGLPLFFMELALGQYYRQGAITTWGRVCPLFKGIGYTVVLIAFYTDFFYNVIISWALYFFFASFTTVLPWSTCNNSWNTDACYEPIGLHGTYSPDGNWTPPVAFETCRKMINLSEANASLSKSSSEEYFNNHVMSLKTSGVDNPGQLKWQLVLCLLVVYLICYFSLWKGIKMSGKVVWFTAIFPYIVLFALLIRGLTLPGAFSGIRYYIYPNISKLGDGEVWFDAATQVFFSLGPGFGVLLAFASYNKFHNNIYLDAIVTSSVNCATSFLAGFVIFAVLGYMSCKSGLPVDKVAAEGPGLVFVVYPEALATMPGSTAWSLMFFMMLMTLGLDSSFGGSEAIITGLSDEYTWIKKHREIFVALLFLLYMVVNLLMCTDGGLYYVEFLSQYAAAFGLLTAVFFETVVISWIYGLQRFVNDIKEMIGFEPGYYWRFCWAVAGPLFLLFNLIYGAISTKPMKLDNYTYPGYMNVLGWILATSSAMAIPIMGVYMLWRSPGDSFLQKLRSSVTPWKETVSPETFYMGVQRHWDTVDEEKSLPPPSNSAPGCGQHTTTTFGAF